ncbi:hypothetical protein DFJ74DRAFT_775629 [Hyaloraphidium curvatum]|nr:hypothetical protein DFJ74DRAFT_775629 [Hyaloraphidium curvatum]
MHHRRHPLEDLFAYGGPPWSALNPRAGDGPWNSASLFNDPFFTNYGRFGSGASPWGVAAPAEPSNRTDTGSGHGQSAGSRTPSPQDSSRSMGRNSRYEVDGAPPSETAPVSSRVSRAPQRTVRLRRFPFYFPTPYCDQCDSDEDDYGMDYLPFGDLFWSDFPRGWYEPRQPATRKAPGHTDAAAAVAPKPPPASSTPPFEEEPRPVRKTAPEQAELRSPASPAAPAKDMDFETSLSHKEMLYSALDSMDIKHKDVGGAGDCLFLSLSDQIANYRAPFGNTKQARFPKLSANQIRGIVVDEIATSRDLYKWDVLALVNGNARSEDEAFDAYVAKMARPGEYGDAICLAAFARVFDCGVVVWMWDDKKDRLSRVIVEWEEDGDGPRVEKRRLHVGWFPAGEGESGNHYFSVFPGDVEL